MMYFHSIETTTPMWCDEDNSTLCTHFTVPAESPDQDSISRAISPGVIPICGRMNARLCLRGD
jgi:hypothetical protein